MKFNKQKVKAMVMEQLSEQPALDMSKMEELLEDLKNNKISISGVEGQNSSEWILLDLGDFVINIMSKDSRALYDLESLWDPALN